MHWNTSALLVTALILGGFSFLANAGDGKDKGDDKKAIQGTWSVTKDNKKMHLTFDDGKFSLEFMGKTASGTYAIDASKKPKQIDMTITDGSDEDTQKYKGKASKAIYEINGTKLKWLAPEPGGDERPTAFPKDGEKVKTLYAEFDRAKK